MCENVLPDRAHNMLKNNDVILLDVRTPSEHAQGYIDGANLIPVNQLPYVADRLPKDKRILLYCRSGSRSYSACTYLRGMGFNNVSHIHGGIISWLRMGLPVTGSQQSYGSSRIGRNII